MFRLLGGCVPHFLLPQRCAIAQAKGAHDLRIIRQVTRRGIFLLYKVNCLVGNSDLTERIVASRGTPEGLPALAIQNVQGLPPYLHIQGSLGGNWRVSAPCILCVLPKDASRSCIETYNQ